MENHQFNSKNIPLSLYIHMPWCVRKCPYCDFNSHPLRSEIPEEDYIERLIQDLKLDLHNVQDRKLKSIFFGGGTPSLISANAIEKILQASKEDIGWEDDIEITLEANPGASEYQRFSGYRKIGVNRISLGVQSFQDEKLKMLGRIHDSHAAENAIIALDKAGFENFNIDIMHGLPSQTISDALFDLEIAIQFKPKHISWYQLTLEPNTQFHHQPPQLPNEKTIDDIQKKGLAFINNNGYMQYEVSAYTLGNAKSKHNLNYWTFGDYLAIGAGAHSKITFPTEIIRTWKVRHPKDYLNPQKNFISGQQSLTIHDLIAEFMLNALRLRAPIEENLFKERTNLTFKDIAPILHSMEEKGLLKQTCHSFLLTDLGHRFLNECIKEFI